MGANPDPVKKRLILVGGDSFFRDLVKNMLSDCMIAWAPTNDRVPPANPESPTGVVLMDADNVAMIPMELIREAEKKGWVIRAVILSGERCSRDLSSQIRVHGYDFVPKPIKADDLNRMVSDIYDTFTFVEVENDSVTQLKPAMDSKAFRFFTGKSQSIQRICALIEKLAQVDTAVFIRGESGTGKELVARAIHYRSNRQLGRFVPVNLSAIPENLVESELFGHEKGAFTGAHSKKIGKLQYADGGTLFLDEIGDVPVNIQVKLLRVLQDKRFSPIGSNREIEVSVRIIAATNRDIEDLIEKRRFRKDLYYRLHVLPILLPPLRERIEDVDCLVRRFIREYNVMHSKSIQGISPEALIVLKNYSWPGNVRELENVIEHAFIIEASDWITPGSLPTALCASPASANVEALSPLSVPILNYRILKEQFERDFLMRALRVYQGRINRTSIGTNMPKKTLLRKILKYKIDADSFKN